MSSHFNISHSRVGNGITFRLCIISFLEAHGSSLSNSCAVSFDLVTSMLIAGLPLFSAINRFLSFYAYPS